MCVYAEIFMQRTQIRSQAHRNMCTHARVCACVCVCSKGTLITLAFIYRNNMIKLTLNANLGRAHRYYTDP